MSFEINNRRYTGSKYKLREWIQDAILNNCHNCNTFCDLFAGTGVITNTMFDNYENFIVNDLLYSNEIIYNAFFSNKAFNYEKLIKYQKKFKNLIPINIADNYVSLNFGGKFFSKNDALMIGEIREIIYKDSGKLNARERDILITSLIYSFDRCANTVGHYDAYFKNKNIKDSFEFQLITLKENKDKNVKIYREDANLLVEKIKADIVYIDPPYSSRQYARFYHLIENIAKWEKPELYGTALKPPTENSSEYCKSKAIDYFKELIVDLKCKYIVVSYNNTYESKSNSSKNKMTLEQITEVLSKKGNTKIKKIEHAAFNAGKTNFDNHYEYLFITKVGDYND